MISQIDILKQKFQNSETADTRVDALHEICWFYAFNDSAEELASYLTDAKKILESEVLSPDYFRHHDILTAFHKSMAVSFSDALEYALEIRLKQAGRFEGAWKWRIHYLFGVIQSYIGNFDDAFFEFQQVHDIAREQNDLPGIHNSLEGIGFVYGYMEDYDNAIEYYLQSLEIANQCAYSHLQFNSNVNLGYTYILTDELDKAESTSQKALAIGVKNGDPRQLGFATARLAFIEIKREEYPVAEKRLLDRLDELPETITTWRPRLNLLRLLARACYMQEKYDEAVKILTKIIEEARAKSDQINVIEALEELVSAYEKSGKFPDALQAQKEYFDLYKKFNSERNNEKVHILETLHRTRETEAELAHQKLIAEEAIQQAERTRNYFEELNKIKGEFIDSATHDLKNPLTSIRLNASILRRKIDPSAHRHLDSIEDGTRRMSSLITDMLDVAKLETGSALNLSAGSITELMDSIQTAQSTFAGEKSIQIKTHYSDDSIHFYFDARYLYRCISNLVSNAIKYSDNNMIIEIDVTVDGEEIVIRIQDHGFGIPEEDLPHIFERFYRVEHETTDRIEGTGLGLSIVKLIVEQHRGKVDVESQLEKGTVFTITLPYLQASA